MTFVINQAMNNYSYQACHLNHSSLKTTNFDKPIKKYSTPKCKSRCLDI